MKKINSVNRLANSVVYAAAMILFVAASHAQISKGVNQVFTAKPDITVAQDGSGDFTHLQAAIDSVPRSNTERKVIFIKNGNYVEHIRIETSFLTFLGEDRKKTRIVWEINDSRAKSRFVTETSLPQP